MSRKRKKYRVSGDESLCLAVSVVDRPAVESDFIALSTDKVPFIGKVEANERRMMYGCALRPDFPIYRREGDREYYLEFDRQAIDTISKNYFKMGFQSNWTAAHKDEVEGLTITESWIKEDMTHDKSIALGLDDTLPVGTWFIGVHCDNDKIWKQVKAGEFHGFSIEAIVGLEELSKQIPEEPQLPESFWTRMKQMLSEALHDPIEPIDIKDMNPQAEAALEEQTSTEPQTAATVTETATTEPQTTTEPAEPVQPKAEPQAQTEPQEPEQPTETAATETATTETETASTQAETASTQQWDEVQKVINNLKDEVEALKKDKEALTKRLDDMGKKPSVEHKNTKPASTPNTFNEFRERMRGYYA